MFQSKINRKQKHTCKKLLHSRQSSKVQIFIRRNQIVIKNVLKLSKVKVLYKHINIHYNTRIPNVNVRHILLSKIMLTMIFLLLFYADLYFFSYEILFHFVTSTEKMVPLNTCLYLFISCQINVYF